MVTERLLFETYPKSRKTDPETSALAAGGMMDSGGWHRQKSAVLALLTRNPGHTSAELARIGGMDRHAVARRLPDLLDDGLAVQGEKKLCEVTRRMGVTWWGK